MQKKPAAAQHQPAVSVPHPGASYNPSLEEYQKLVQQAAEIEQKKADLQKQIDEYLSYREELDDLKGELDDVESEEEEVDPEDKEALEKLRAAKKKKEGIRKTRAQRNKQKRLKSERVERIKRDQLRKLRRQIDEWTEIEKGIKERMGILKEQNESRQKHKEEAEKEGKKRLGKHKVQEMPVDVQLPEDLSDTLRQLKVCIIVLTATILIMFLTKTLDFFFIYLAWRRYLTWTLCQFPETKHHWTQSTSQAREKIQAQGIRKAIPQELRSRRSPQSQGQGSPVKYPLKDMATFPFSFLYLCISFLSVLPFCKHIW